MGASKTKVVGGNPTSALGQQYSTFLGNALGQTGDAGHAIHGLLNGQIGNGNPLYSGGYNIPQLAGQVGQVSAPQINTGAFTQGLGTQVTAPGIPTGVLNQQFGPNVNGPNYGALFNQQFGANVPQLNLGQFATGPYGGPTSFNYHPQGLQGIDMNGQTAQAVQGVYNNQLQQGLADLHARYSAGGAGGVSNAGTPAAVAEAIYRANALPQIGQTLGNLNLQEQQNQISNLGVNNQAGLGFAQLGANTGLQARGQDISQLGNLLNAGLQQRGQDIGAQLQGQGLGLQQASTLGSLLGNQYSTDVGAQLQGQGLGLQQNQTLLQSLLSQRGQDLTSGVESRGLDINQLGLLGSLAGQNAQLGLQGSMANASNALQMLGLGQNYNLGMGGLNLQNQGQVLQGQLGALSPLLGGINNLAMAGTPQAQVVQQKSGLAQALGTIGNLGMGIGSMMMGMPPGVGSSIAGLFGMGGSGGFGGLSNDTLQGMNSMLPSFSVPNVWG